MWDHRAKSARVIDGDTLVTYEDWGKGLYEQTTVRLFGTFAPEMKETGGPETKAFAEKWIVDHSKGDWPLIVQYIRNKPNTAEETTFGRYVCMVFDAVTGESLNTAVSAFVVANGYPHGTGGS